MKVLLISLGTKSGIAQYPAQLANGLADLVDIHVLTPVNEEIKTLYHQDVTLHQIQPRVLRPPIKYLSAYLDIIRGIQEISPDIIHVPFYNTFEISLAPILTLYPAIATIHDPISHSGMDRFGIFTKMRVASSRVFDSIIVHGKVCKKQAIEAGFQQQRVRTLPHGLYDLFKEHGKQIEETAYPVVRDLDAPTILFFGEIRPNKGYDRVEAILQKVQEQEPSTKAIVAGSPNLGGNKMENTLKTLDDNEDIILIPEYIPLEEVRPFFIKSDVVVLPYYDATASGVAMIAYTFNTPIVTTDTGELGEIVRKDNSGIVASTNSTCQIANSVSSLVTDDNQRKDIIDNIRDARCKYEWSTIAYQTKEIYKKVINSDRR